MVNNIKGINLVTLNLPKQIAYFQLFSGGQSQQPVIVVV